MLLWSHQIYHPIISRTPMWNETNRLQGTVMPKKPSSIERGMPLCKVHQTKCVNHVSCSNVEKGHLISSEELTWLKNPSSTEKSMPQHNGHPIEKKSLRWLCPSVGSYHNSWSITIKNALESIPSVAHIRAIKHNTWWVKRTRWAQITRHRMRDPSHPRVQLNQTPRSTGRLSEGKHDDIEASRGAGLTG